MFWPSGKCPRLHLVGSKEMKILKTLPPYWHKRCLPRLAELQLSVMTLQTGAGLFCMFNLVVHILGINLLD